MRRTLYILSMITILMAMGLMILCMYWYFYPYKILDFKDPKFPVITKKIHQGGVLKFQSRFCKNMDIPAETSGSFINGIVFNVPMVTTNRDTGCKYWDKGLEISISIPSELPIGKIHFQRIYRFKVNPIRTITYTHSTETFEIIESTQSAELRMRGY